MGNRDVNKCYSQEALSLHVDNLLEQVDDHEDRLEAIEKSEAKISTQVDLIVKVNFAILAGVISLLVAVLTNIINK